MVLWQRVFAFLKSLGFGLVHDPLGLKPSAGTLAGLFTAADGAKVLLAGALGWVVTHETALSLLLGSTWGPWLVAVAGVLLQGYRLWTHGDGPGAGMPGVGR